MDEILLVADHMLPKSYSPRRFRARATPVTRRSAAEPGLETPAAGIIGVARRRVQIVWM
jgi:hypothetical protein